MNSLEIEITTATEPRDSTVVLKKDKRWPPSIERNCIQTLYVHYISVDRCAEAEPESVRFACMNVSCLLWTEDRAAGVAVHVFEVVVALPEPAGR